MPKRRHSKTQADIEADKAEKQRTHRVNHNAYSNFNNNYNKQPPTKVNIGEKLERVYEANGQEVVMYMNGMNVSERIEAMKQIKIELQGLFPGPVGEELRTMEESVYVTSKPNQDILDQQPPWGIGLRPADLNVETQAEYQTDKIAYYKRFGAAHVKYVMDCAQAKIHVMEKRIASDIMLSLDQVPAFVAAKAQYVSMVIFLQELEKAVINILKIDDQISVVDTDIESLQKLIDDLTVKDEGDSLRYCVKVRELIAQLKALKVKLEVDELSGILDAATRAQRTREITARIEREIDGNNLMMFGIYEELLTYGIDKDSQDMFNRRAAEQNTRRNHAPFPRSLAVVAGVQTITGGIDNMLKKFESIIRRIKQDYPNRDVYYVKSKEFKKPLNTGGSQPPNQQGNQLHINNADLVAKAQAIITGQITQANAAEAAAFMNAAQTALSQNPAQDPCHHCLHTLHFPKTAFKHVWSNCFYNPTGSSYVGAEKAAAALAKSKKYQDEKQAQATGRPRLQAKKK